MATVGTFNKVLRVRPRAGFRLQQKEVTIAASQDIKKYDIISKSSGANTFEQSLALDGTDNTGTESSGTTAIYGVAAAPITTGAGGSEDITGRTTIPVWVFDDNLELCMRIWDETPIASEAEPRDLALATTYKFQRWRGASASQWWYSLLSTATGEFTYVERAGSSADEDDYGLVWVLSVPARRQG